MQKISSSSIIKNINHHHNEAAIFNLPYGDTLASVAVRLKIRLRMRVDFWPQPLGWQIENSPVVAEPIHFTHII